MTLLDSARHLVRINRVFTLIAIALTLAVAVFLVYDRLVPPPLRASAGDSIAASQSLDLLQAVGAAEAQQRIRGRAALRTLRVAPKKIVNELGRFHLEGVFLRGGTYRAWVRDEKAAQTLTVVAGDVLGGIFEVIAVEPTGITLRRGAEEQILTQR